MIDERTLRVLEFGKVIEMLEREAVTPMGREICSALLPQDDPERVTRDLAETSEAVSVLSSGSPPLRAIVDVRGAVRRCAMGGTIGAEELARVAAAASGFGELKRFLLKASHDGSILRSHAERLHVLSELVQTIGGCISEDAQVRDDASPELRKLRNQKRALSARIREKLDSMVRSPEFHKYLQEPIVTIRDDRFCVPVRQECRAMVPGVIHDQSASGATLFIEPMQVLELNNDLRRAEAAENEEIARILRELSGYVARYSQAILESMDAVGAIDFAFAKGRLSMKMNAVEPIVRPGWVVDLRRARHPLLKGEVVPVDIHLGRTFDTLVITGPNTGGKTVTLKTVGLLVLMAQSGLHIPAAPDSIVSVFPKVFCDIGDEQSIEQSLSTFSSHMSNIVRITRDAGEGSLVLLDELGAGTDPTEGSALAMAILEHLHAAGAKTIATTHYSELKSFAFSRERVENASVEFDVETLRPTYRLTIGLPGRSNAFEISKRLGLDHRIIDAARRYVGGETRRVEELIAEIEKARGEAEAQLRAAESARAAAERLRMEFSRRLEETKAREQEILEKARTEAIAIVQKAKARSREAIERLKEAEKEEAARRAALVQTARDALREAERDTRQQVQADEVYRVDAPVPRDLKPGETVYVKTVGQVGYVIEPPDAGGNAVVQLGIMKVQVRVEDLARTESSGKDAGFKETDRLASASLGRLGSEKAREVPAEIDVRGLTTDEAVLTVDKYLDDAFLGGARQVRIIHGKGTGALRKAVSDLLKRHPHVAGFRLGVHGEGGDGASIVTLR